MKFFIFAFIIISSTCFAADRVALVIGNGGYTYSPLKNSLNDASMMAKKLGSLGFKVFFHTELNRAELRNIIRNVTDELTEQSEFLFYYAGHAVQYNGVNFIYPLGADVQSEDEIEEESLSLNFLLKKLATKSPNVSIIVLDACRDNPFSGSFSRSTSDQGLAYLKAPVNSYIAYATSPGEVASDSLGGNNSPFTQSLLKHIGTDGINIGQLFQRVRKDVTSATDGKQVPFDSTSLTTDFCFSSCNGGGSPTPLPDDDIISPPPRDVAVSMTTELTELFFNRTLYGDIAELINMYSYPVQNYFNLGPKTKDQVREGLRNYYNNRWQERESEIKNITLESALANREIIRMKLDYSFKFKTTAGKKVCGTSKNNLTFTWVKDSYKIIAISEKVKTKRFCF